MTHSRIEYSGGEKMSRVDHTKPQKRDGSPNTYYWLKFVSDNNLTKQDVINKIIAMEIQIKNLVGNNFIDRRSEIEVDDLIFEMRALESILHFL